MKKLLIGLAIGSCFLAACTSKTTSTSGTDSTLIKNKATAMKTDKAFLAGDVDGVYKDCDTNYVEYGSGEMKPIKNLDTLKAGLKAFYASYTNLKGENLHAYADSNTVIITGDWSSTFSKDYMKRKATQKTTKLFDADIFTFNPNGKIASHKAIQSNIAYLYYEGSPLPPLK